MMGAYVIQAAATATPTFSPAAGTYSAAQSVAISDTTPGAVIYYTTNGTAPTTSSAVYSSAIAVSANTTVEALAVAPGFAPECSGQCGVRHSGWGNGDAHLFTRRRDLHLCAVSRDF